MVVFKKLSETEFNEWLAKYCRTKKPALPLGEQFMADNFPGHVDNRIQGLDRVEQMRIIVENYMVPKETQ